MFIDFRYSPPSKIGHFPRFSPGPLHDPRGRSNRWKLRRNTAGLDPPRRREVIGKRLRIGQVFLRECPVNLTLLNSFFFIEYHENKPLDLGFLHFSNFVPFLVTFRDISEPGRPTALGSLEASCSGCVDRRTPPWELAWNIPIASYSWLVVWIILFHILGISNIPGAEGLKPTTS